MSLLSRSLGGALVASVLLIGGGLAFTAVQTAPVIAQADTAAAVEEGDPVRGKKVYMDVGRCTECHGWGGNGFGSNPRSPGKAADLRKTQLDTATLQEVIRCGIPGTEMPYHLSAAYKAPETCYGMVAADFGEGEMPKKGKTFREKDIVNLVAFIEQWYKPKGDAKITLAECEEFFEGPSKNCTGLK